MGIDFVVWGVIICVVGSAAVAGWLLYVTYRNATKGQDKQ